MLVTLPTMHLYEKSLRFLDRMTASRRDRREAMIQVFLGPCLELADDEDDRLHGLSYGTCYSTPCSTTAMLLDT